MPVRVDAIVIRKVFIMKTKLPNNTLTFVIRDDSRMVHCGDSPTYRTVHIELTEEQIQQIKLNYTHTVSGKEYYEEISRCFIEPSRNDV